MKISFGLILYNEEKLVEQQLFNLYPHAHEIIIVEGRVTEFGDKFPKERDNTLRNIKHFQKHHDPENKVKLITREVWVGKTVMVNEYYQTATGDYVWHIDADEFYSDECINRTKEYIAETDLLNYAHDEYYYFRCYNVVVAKAGKQKFWNYPARIHKCIKGRQLFHRPQILVGTKPGQTGLIPRSVGIRHHYSCMERSRVNIKAHFYGYTMHAPYLKNYTLPMEHVIQKKLCVRPDNNKKENSFAVVLKKNELEIPPGVTTLFDYFKSGSYPWTIDGYESFQPEERDVLPKDFQ